MTQKINPVPKGYRSVTPGLVVRGVDAAIEFYEQVFDASAVSRAYDESDQATQVELKIGGSIVLLAEERLEWGLLSPLALGATPVGQKVFIADPDAVFERAMTAGARPLLPMTQIGISERSDERMGRFVDPFGHVWTVAARVPAAPRVDVSDPANDASNSEAPDTAGTGTDGDAPQA